MRALCFLFCGSFFYFLKIRPTEGRDDRSHLPRLLPRKDLVHRSRVLAGLRTQVVAAHMDPDTRRERGPDMRVDSHKRVVDRRKAADTVEVECIAVVHIVVAEYMLVVVHTVAAVNIGVVPVAVGIVVLLVLENIGR